MIHFVAANSRALRRRGLFGAEVTVTLRDGELRLSGADGGHHTIALANVAHVRVGYTDGKRRIWELILQPVGEDALVLIPLAASWASYRDVVRSLVNQMATLGRLDRVHVGSSKADALFAPVLLGAVALAAIGIATLVITNEPWWGRLILATTPTALWLLVTTNARRTHWPRPLVDVRQLSDRLPPQAK